MSSPLLDKKFFPAERDPVAGVELPPPPQFHPAVYPYMAVGDQELRLPPGTDGIDRLEETVELDVVAVYFHLQNPLR